MPAPDPTAPLTRAQLDRMTCARPGCDHSDLAAHTDGLVLNARCHVKKPQIVWYWGGGVVEVRCKICNGFVCSVAVSPEDQVQFDAKIACDDPTCKEPVENHKLLMRPPCHNNAGSVVVYQQGALVFACAKCNRQFTHVHVKESTAVA